MNLTLLSTKFNVHENYIDSENEIIGLILDWIIPNKYAGYTFNNATMELRVFLLEEINTETFNLLNDTFLSGDTSLPVISFSRVKSILREAIHFGNELILEFATENTILGITRLGLTYHVVKITTPILSALQTGAFHVAIEELRKIPVSALDEIILTPERLRKFRNQIESFLGVPQAEVWNQ